MNKTRWKTHLWAWAVTVLDKRLPTNLHSHLLCSRTVFDEAVLSKKYKSYDIYKSWNEIFSPEILITLFLLLGLISSFVACGASWKKSRLVQIV